MWCPHGIGRDSWVWGEQGTLEMMNSPHEVGDEALIERRPCQEKTGWPLDKMIVVVAAAVVVAVVVRSRACHTNGESR